MKLVYSILLSKEINKDEFVSFVKDTELLFVPRLSTRVSLIESMQRKCISTQLCLLCGIWMMQVN